MIETAMALRANPYHIAPIFSGVAFMMMRLRLARFSASLAFSGAAKNPAFESAIYRFSCANPFLIAQSIGATPFIQILSARFLFAWRQILFAAHCCLRSFLPLFFILYARIVFPPIPQTRVFFFSCFGHNFSMPEKRDY